MSKEQIVMGAEYMIWQFMNGRVFLTAEGENRLREMIERYSRPQ